MLTYLADLDLDLDPSSTWVIQVQSHLAKGIKDAIKDAGWLDNSKKAGVLRGAALAGADMMGEGSEGSQVSGGSYVQLPLHLQAVHALKQAALLGLEATGSTASAVSIVLEALCNQSAKVRLEGSVH
jgi:hypothetical protein